VKTGQDEIDNGYFVIEVKVNRQVNVQFHEHPLGDTQSSQKMLMSPLTLNSKQAQTKASDTIQATATLSVDYFCAPS